MTNRHQQRQQKLQKLVNEKIATADKTKGVLMVITGDGKGKSTAGFGSITRAVGHGNKAAVVQFIKGNWDCGERQLLTQLGVKFEVMNTGFTWDTQDKAKDTQAAEKSWAVAQQWLQDDTLDIILLDELTYMISYHYLDIENVITALVSRPANQHVIITGRHCHRRLIELADTVSEIKNIKHAFDAGIKAQKGFDY